MKRRILHIVAAAIVVVAAACSNDGNDLEKRRVECFADGGTVQECMALH